MGEVSNIEWCDSTVNFWIGCTKLSPACDFCYAEDWARRFKLAEWGNHPRHRTAESTWKNPLKWQREAEAFFEKKGRQRRVFPNSLSDFFDNQVDHAVRLDAWDVIRQCDDLIWMILTKRPQNIPRFIPADWGNGWRHVWLGTTTENQEEANKRIPPLLEVPAALHFISAEPLLGPVDLFRIPTTRS